MYNVFTLQKSCTDTFDPVKDNRIRVPRVAVPERVSRELPLLQGSPVRSPGVWPQQTMTAPTEQIPQCLKL